MSYLTGAQLAARVGGSTEYIELTDDNDDGATDPGVEAFVLGQVDDMVDGFARRGGYSVPLAFTDYEEIEPFLLNIANYLARTRGNRNASEDDRKLYDDAMKVLYGIADGTFKLPSYTATSTVTLVGLSSEPQLFSRTLLRDL